MFPQDLYPTNRAAYKGMSPLSGCRITVGQEESAEGASWSASDAFASTEMNLNVMLVIRTALFSALRNKL